MGHIKVVLKSKLRPSDPGLWQSDFQVSTLAQINLGLVQFLKETMFAAWGPEGRQYYPNVEAKFEYIPTDNEEHDEILAVIDKDIREENETHRRETALDEEKTAHLWARSEPRYWVTIIISEFDGYQNVDFHLFHTEMSNEELARLVVLAPGRSIDDVAHWYTASAIEQTFSKAEVKQLYAYFKQWGNVRLKARRTSPPTNDSMGYGAYPVGGGNDFYTFSEVPGYSLPFKVWGYFDLRHRG